MDTAPNYQDVIILSPELDESIKAILSADAATDTSEFPVVEYLNATFPNGQSLAHANKVLNNLQGQIQQLNRELRVILRADGNHSTQQNEKNDKNADEDEITHEIIRVKIAMEEMIARMKTIKEKATDSEKMVQEITRDIKTLDHGKRNLTLSITVLRRVQMLISAMEQLRGMASRKQYTQVAQLLQVVLQLVASFRSYSSVKQVSSIMDSVKQFQLELKTSILTEFEASFNTGILKLQTDLLNDACLVLEILDLEGSAKKELMDWYCEMQLKDYRSIFKSSFEVSGLDSISRRFAWLKRILKTFDEEHTTVFPGHWKMAEYFCEMFCIETRKALSEVCNKSDTSMDVKILIQAIQTTIEFEEKLEKRFFSKTSNKFQRIISSCYEPYLRHYISFQDKSIHDMMENYRTRNIIDEEDSVISSSTDLFYYYRQTLTNFSQFSKNKAFADLSKLFGKWLKNYADTLLAFLPRDDRKIASSDNDLKIACLVLNTSEYCAQTISQLEEKIQELVEEDLKSQISFNTEKDAFMRASGVALQTLVKSVELCLDPSLTIMIRRPWGTIESVGDQSEYVSQIALNLTNCMKTIRKHLTSPLFLKMFCDKFAESFLSKFYSTIFKCRPLSSVGAEQMLLDTIALKTILSQIPVEGQPSTTFQKIMGKGISKIEQLLKVAIRSHEPPDGIVETYIMLYHNDNNISNFQKILELKGLKRSEQVVILDVFQRKINATNPATSSSDSRQNQSVSDSTTSMNQPVSPIKSDNNNDTLRSSISTNTGKKLQTDFRKFMGGMNIKRT